jgi:hypothetical protein
MKKPWILYTGGSLTLFVGLIQILVAFAMLCLYLILKTSASEVQLHQAVVYVTVIPLLVSGSIGITGGVLTILKRKWTLSLIFSIFTGALFILELLGLFPQITIFWMIFLSTIGVAPTVFLVLSKNQFAPKNLKNK